MLLIIARLIETILLSINYNDAINDIVSKAARTTAMRLAGEARLAD